MVGGDENISVLDEGSWLKTFNSVKEILVKKEANDLTLLCSVFNNLKFLAV